MRLAGKVALVSGAASGVGHAICELFAREGALVFAGDVAMPSTLLSKGIHPLTLDGTGEASWAAAIFDAIAFGGRLDVLVNIAGAVDRTGVFLGMAAAVPVMRRQRAGSIVNVSPTWSGAATAGHAHQAARDAIISMSRNAAVAYAGDGVRVNSVHPGFIDTPQTRAQAAHLATAAIEATPMKRAGTPMEVAHGCLFLASDEASYVTGAQLVIDGGAARNSAPQDQPGDRR